MQNLGLPGNEAYELAKSTNFNVQRCLKRKQDLHDSGATKIQIFNSIMKDIQKCKTDSKLNEILPSSSPQTSNVVVGDNDGNHGIPSNKRTCNSVSKNQETPAERNGNLISQHDESMSQNFLNSKASNREETKNEEATDTTEKQKIINPFKQATSTGTDAKLTKAAENLCYAVVDACNPMQKLPVIHGPTIRETIRKEIMLHNKEAARRYASKIYVNTNKFVNGHLILTLDNDSCKKVLKKIVEAITTPWKGGNLTIVKLSEILPLTKASLLLPPFSTSLDNNTILTLFEKQNKDLNINNWIVFYRKNTKEGTSMVIGLDELSVQNLSRIQNKPKFGDEHVNFNIHQNTECKNDSEVQIRLSDKRLKDMPDNWPESAGTFPAEPSDPNKILKILQKSNPDLPTHDWKIVNITPAADNCIKANMTLNNDSYLPLRRVSGKVFYGFGTINLQVFRRKDKKKQKRL